MDVIAYYLKANLVFAVLLGAYHLALRKETWFHARRAWLLASALLAIALPLIPLDSVGDRTLTFTLPPVMVQGAQGDGIVWSTWAIALHLVISVVLLLRLAAEVRSTLNGLHGSSAPAGSFLRHVHVPDALSGADRRAIIVHEEVHARHGHSIDVLLYRVVAAVFWSNPLWWLALRELRLVHELTADSSARSTHTDYGSLLVAHAFGTSPTTLLNTFGSSNLKHRLNMLYNERSPERTRTRLLIAVPALALALVMVSWQAAPAPLKDLTRLATVFPGVDQQPEYPGGMEALAQYMAKSVRYPAAAQKDKVEGTVFVSFTVKNDGSIADATVKRSVRKDLDDEAVRVVSGMPNWKPAQSKGKAVAAEMVLPVAFKLSEQK